MTSYHEKIAHRVMPYFLSLGMGLLEVACAMPPAESANESADLPSEDRNVLTGVSYARRYNSLNELVEQATLVARGQIVADGESYRLGQVGGEYGVAFQDAKFRVDNVLYGDLALEGEEVTIGQTVGLELEPLMKVGEEYILFLKPWRGPEEGKMYSIGGYAGRFKVTDDGLWRAATHADREPLSSEWNGRAASELEQAILRLD
jgi:hypothetical protein